MQAKKFSLQANKEYLQNLRDELTKRITAIEKDIHHKDQPVEKDFAEQVTQRENDDVLNALDDEAKQTVFQIDAALNRITDGSYGLCESCGNDIAEARLQALPYATTCVSCAQ